MIRSQFPNVITLGSIFLGFLSILNSFMDEYSIACYFILIAAILDSVDGKIARLFGVTSDFGKQLDSLSDLVSFCIAPSFLIYVLFSHGMPGISGEIIACIPLFIGVIRLARFNIKEDNPYYFEGLPTTFNAIFICSLALYVQHYNMIYEQSFDTRLSLSLILISSFLMVTKINFPKFPALNFKSGKRNSLRLLFLFLAGSLMIISVIIDKYYIFFVSITSLMIMTGITKHIIITEKVHIKFVNKIIRK